MIIVVSDTSPLLALHHLDLIPILGKLFKEVVIPPAVKRELESPRPKFDAIDISRFAFMDVRIPHDVARVASFL